MQQLVDERKDVTAEVLDNVINKIKPEITKAAKEVTQNTFNFYRMSGYQHSSFILEVEQFAPNLVRLLNGLLHTSKKCNPEDAALHRHVLANILAWFLESHNDQFSWEFASVLQLIVRSLARSATVTNMLSTNIPGGCSSQTLTTRLERFADFVEENAEPVDGNSTAYFLYDQTPDRRGYVGKATRGGKENKNTLPIATACAVMHVFSTESNTLSLQKYEHLSPRNDDMESPIPANLHLPRTVRWPEDEVFYPHLPFVSESEHLENEIMGYLRDRLNRGLWKIVVEESTAKKRSKYLQEAEKALGVIPTTKPCANRACQQVWPLNKQTCNGTLGCSTKQLTAKEYLCQLMGMKLENDEEQEQINTKFTASVKREGYSRRAKASKFFDGSCSSSTTVTDDAITDDVDDPSFLLDKIQFVDTTHPESGPNAPESLAKMEEMLHNQLEERDLLGHKLMRYEVLLTVFENPNTKKAIQQVLVRYAISVLTPSFYHILLFRFNAFLISELEKFCDWLVSSPLLKCREGGRTWLQISAPYAFI